MHCSRPDSGETHVSHSQRRPISRARPCNYHMVRPTRSAEDAFPQSMQFRAPNEAARRGSRSSRKALSVKAMAVASHPSKRVVVTGMGVVTSLGFDADTFYKCD